MKTVGDLRKAIKDNGGELKIGLMRFTFEDDDDIDLHWGSELILWINKAEPDATLLDAEGITTTVDGFVASKEKIGEQATEIKDLKKEVETLTDKVKDGALSVGMVQAYEKILIGRDVTISK